MVQIHSKAKISPWDIHYSTVVFASFFLLVLNARAMHWDVIFGQHHNCHGKFFFDIRDLAKKVHDTEHKLVWATVMLTHEALA